MSSRQRALDVRIADGENLNKRPGKQVAKTVTTNRPALFDVGNNFVREAKNNVEKPKPRGVPIKKQITTNVPTKKTAHISTTTTSSKSDALVTLKREDSTLIKRNLHVSSERTLSENASYSTKQLMTIIDADAKDKDDPFLVAEYVVDIFNYLRTLESKYPIKKNYLSSTHCSTPRMRSVLVSWIVDVHINFRLLQETLHLSIALLDRYLQKHTTVGRDTLQLVGVTAMVIACKYEEMYMPDMNDFVYICDDTFSANEIKKMERDMLSTLKFNLGRPLSLHFLRRYNKVAAVSPEHHNLAKYLLELFLLHHELCHINPSLQAAAASCLSLSILNDVSEPSKVWTKALVHYSSYKYTDIKPVIINLANVLYKMDKCKFQSIREKYSSSTYGKISLNPKLQGTVVKTLMNQPSPKN